MEHWEAKGHALSGRKILAIRRARAPPDSNGRRAYGQSRPEVDAPHRHGWWASVPNRVGSSGNGETAVKMGLSLGLSLFVTSACFARDPARQVGLAGENDQLLPRLQAADRLVAWGATPA